MVGAFDASGVQPTDISRPVNATTDRLAEPAETNCRKEELIAVTP
jgi:hypothetical protein